MKGGRYAEQEAGRGKREENSKDRDGGRVRPMTAARSASLRRRSASASLRRRRCTASQRHWRDTSNPLGCDTSATSATPTVSYPTKLIPASRPRAVQ